MIDSFYVEIHQAREVMRLLKEIQDEKGSCAEFLEKQSQKCTELYAKIEAILAHLETATLKQGGTDGRID